MPILPQTANFPPIDQPERSWDHSLRAFAQSLFPHGRIIEGLKLGIPTAGLVPTLTDGLLLHGDKVIGPFGSKLIDAAPVNATRMGLHYGLRGMRYADADNTPDESDVLIGEVSTDADGVRSVVQYWWYGPGRVAVKGVVNVAKQATGAQPIATVNLPEFEGCRIAHAHVRASTVAGAAATLEIAHDGTSLVTGTLNNAATVVATIGTGQVIATNTVNLTANLSANNPTGIGEFVVEIHGF